MASSPRRTQRGLRVAVITAALLGGLVLAAPPSSAGQSVSDLNTSTPDDLAAMLAGEGVTVDNVTYTGDNAAGGLFTGLDVVGFADGVILSSGDVNDIFGPNDADDTTTDFDNPGDPDLDAIVSPFGTNDAAALEFEFTPDTNAVSFSYVFGSEEYNEYVNTEFNDVFGFFINGQNCAMVDGDPVSINTINNGNPFDSDPRSHPEEYRNNDPDDGGTLDTEADGLTVTLPCSSVVNAGEVNTMKLAIADTDDFRLDSWVFIQEGSLQSVSAPTCGNGAFSTTPGTAVATGLTPLASDPDGDALTFTVVDQPASGTLSGTAPDLTYTPNAGFLGTDSFTYRANDGILDCDPIGRVDVTVAAAAVVAAPVAQPIQASPVFTG